MALSSAISFAQGNTPDTLWFKYNDRFIANEYIPLDGTDSIEFTKLSLKRWKTLDSGKTTSIGKSYFKNGYYRIDPVERHLAKSNTYSNVDFTKESSQFCFQRSAESEHFVIFWEKGMTKSAAGNITYDGYTVNVNTMLKDAEKIWKCYVEDLGFLTPGNSTTDRVKIEMYIVKNGWDGAGDTWRADGSGTDATYYVYSGTTKTSKPTKVGVFHCTTRAAGARNGHTLAHEIGHTFQYLVAADLGSTHGFGYGIGQGRDNEWWEDCANWQGYKVYPQYQYSDGEYYEQYLDKHHLNIHHEDIRYTSCYYQDYWCQLHGKNTIARVWRESVRPEDPTQAYMRLFGLNEQTFGDEMYQAFAHLASMDIEGIHSNSQLKIGYEPQRLIAPSNALRNKYLNDDNQYWIVDPAYCPENYGYNANPLKVPAAGTVVKAAFKGLAGCDGYKKVNTKYAGWRYGLVAYSADGTRTYSAPCADAEGEVSLTVPDGCTNMWLVVMGAPTKYWSHSWSSGEPSTSFPENGEQWPYAVKFSGTDPLGVSRTYGDYPEDYERKDTTVVINATLAYSSSGYSFVSVKYDMDAISQALGVSTKQMQAIKRNTKPGTKGSLVFAGLNANGKTFTYNTTTSTSSNSCYGHWFNTSGNVCNYDNTAAIYAEMFPETYNCSVGQYPGHLSKGKTYKIRQAIIYTHTDGQEYKAIMEVHLKVY